MVNVAESYCVVKPKELNFDEKTIDKRLKATLFESIANKQESFWDSLKSHVLKSLKDVVEGCLQEEACIESGAGWHERALTRIDHRNGTYIREILAPALVKSRSLLFLAFARGNCTLKYLRDINAG